MRSVCLFLLAILLLAGSGSAQQSPTLSFLTSSFPHLTSVAVDSTDYLYVLNGSTLVEFNAPRSVVWTIDLSASLRSPVAMKVDAAGQIYVTDMQLGAVVVFDSEGDQLAVYDGLSGAVSDGKRLSPAGLAFDRSAALYVVDTANSRVVVFNGYGNVTQYLDIKTGINAQQLVDVVVDSLGMVYVSDVGNSVIVVLNGQNNTEVALWSVRPSQGLGLAIDSSNFVYVADSSNNTILVFNTAGQLQWYETWDSYQLAPNWLALNSANQLFIADVAHSTVGVLTGVILPGTILSVISGQIGPLAVAVSNTSLLVIVNSLPTNIQAVQLYRSDYEGTEYALTAVNATHPAAVAVSNAGNFVCQTDANFVNCYAVDGYPTGRLVSVLEIQAPTQTGAIATAVAIDDVQLLTYVLIAWSNPNYPPYVEWKVQLFNFAGQYVTTRDYGLNSPAAVAVSPLNGAVYITDTGNNRIVVANRQGTQLHTWSGFQQPLAVAVDSDNRVYVTTVPNQLLILDSRGNRLYTIEHGFNHPSSVAVDRYGCIILADCNNNRIAIMQGVNTPLQRGEQQHSGRKQVGHAKEDMQAEKEEGKDKRFAFHW